MTAVRVLTPITQPLDLASTLDSGQCFRWRPEADGAWTGVLGGDVVRLRAASQGLLIESAPTSPEQMVPRVMKYLRMDDDLPAIQRRLSVDPHMAQGVAAYPGLRLLRQDPWETLAAFILSSTSNIPRIRRTVELIAVSCGQAVTLDGMTRHTFPSPERLAQVGEAELRRLGCGFRAPYLEQAAQAVATGQLPLSGFRGVRYQEAAEALTALRGVGDKVADCVMLFSLDRLEAFPVDRWVQRAMQEWYGAGPLKRYDDARKWAWERFGQDAGYANQYLFWRRRQGQGAALHSQGLPLDPLAGPQSPKSAR